MPKAFKQGVRKSVPIMHKVCNSYILLHQPKDPPGSWRCQIMVLMKFAQWTTTCTFYSRITITVPHFFGRRDGCLGIRLLETTVLTYMNFLMGTWLLSVPFAIVHREDGWVMLCQLHAYPAPVYLSLLNVCCCITTVAYLCAWKKRLFTSRVCIAHLAGPHCDFVSVSLTVRPSVQALSGNESMVWELVHVLRSSYVAGLFSSSLQKKAKWCQYYRL